MAARVATRPNRSLRALADQLRDASSGLDALSAGDATADVRAVFSWSYQAVGPEARRLFRLLGLIPGPDIAAPAVASLAGIPISEVRPLPAELCRARLLTESVPDRCTFHDLLRAYATDLALAESTEEKSRTANHRLLDHGIHTARMEAG